MSTNQGKSPKSLDASPKKKLKQKKPVTEASDGNVVLSIKVPQLNTSSDNTKHRNTDNKPGADQEPSLKDQKTNKDKNNKTKRKTSNTSTRFSDAGQEDQVLRSPSRLGHLEDIPIIIEGTWDNTSQESNAEELNLNIDLKGITEEREHPKAHRDTNKHPGDSETKEFGQQTDFPLTPNSATNLTSVERKEEKRGKQFVTSHRFLNENIGRTPQHPFEKTVFYVKSPRSTLEKVESSTKVSTNRSTERPLSSPYQYKSEAGSQSRIDSGYGSRQETIRIPGSPHKPLSGKSVTISESELVSPVRTSAVSEDLKSPVKTSSHEDLKLPLNENKAGNDFTKMSYYATDIYSPTSSARKQEKQDLQQLNERFSHYIQRVRLLSEQSNRLDAGSFIKQTRILEEEVANLKTLYERELDVLRQELNTLSREKNNYQVQCDKNRQTALDLESRLAAETDKSRRLTDNINGLQRQITNLENEVMNLRSVGDGRVDFQGLQREMDKLIRENEDHKRRQEQEALLRAEAEDRCHTLVKKLEFNEEVHAQQMNELRERLEQSQATIISLESRVNQATQNDIVIPDILKQVREQAELELKRYQMESTETYNRNIAALKCQMDNDANTIERLQGEKSALQGQIGELNAKIRNLEGQILTLEHQRGTVEGLIQQERQRSSEQIQEMEHKLRDMQELILTLEHQRGTVEGLIQQERQRSSEQIQEMEHKLRDMQELVFTKMQEANLARDLHVPLKAEIEAMKVLLEEEEKRLQTPYVPSVPPTLTPTNTPLNLPSVTHQSTQQTTNILQPQTQLYTTVQPTTTVVDSTFVTQSAAHNQYQEPQEPLFTHVPLPNVSEQNQFSTDYVGTTRYTYESTPSVNRLQINSSPRNSPRVVGPISRAKSAPVRQGQLIPSTLGQGKDYFDEMFKDLTRETLYTQTRPKSSPLDRPPSAPRERPASAARERSPSKTERIEARVPSPPTEAVNTSKPMPERPSSAAAVHEIEVTDGETQIISRQDRPQSSVFHDYTTSTSSAVGEIKILEVNQDGKFVRLVNEGKQEIEFGGYMIQQNVGGHPVAIFRFPPRTKFADNSTITIWAGTTDPIEHQPPKDFVWKEQQKWGTGPECTTILCKPNGQAIAWMTAAHRFTKNPYDDTASTTDDQVYETGNPVVSSQDEILTEMNVNLNEPKPEPVYLRREKQTPPSLNAQKHPHGTSPGKDTHPHTGQPRPLTYGNDNTSVNRQSRVQSTRPDPIPGQPYAGSSANRIGSAPLRKYKTVSSGTIRGSGVLANRSDNPGVTTPPPNPFQPPHQRFETGLGQLQSQHHVDFLPPMPRPPLFSTW